MTEVRRRSARPSRRFAALRGGRDVRDAPSRFLRLKAFDAGLVLVVNPADDHEFVGWARRMADRIETGPEDLQAMLRAHYPGAVVRRRDLANERGEVWYVYRDGRWVSSSRGLMSDAG